MITLRSFQPDDAEAISAMISRNSFEVNIKDYSLADMQKFASNYTPERVLSIAADSHMYVLCDADTLVGSGAIGLVKDNPKECILLTLFILPDYQGRGLGRRMMQALESDPLFLQATHIIVDSSITACAFYEKFGYSYENGVKTLIDNDYYLMEKNN